MASGTNSLVRERPLTLARLTRALRAQSEAPQATILVLRLPQFERIAWRDGKPAALRLERNAARAFVRAARQSLRSEDLLAHDAHSDVFVAALVAGPRRNGAPDYRAALERIAASMSMATGLSVETGWSVARSKDRESDFCEDIARALERGRAERERYEFFAAVGHELRTPLTAIRGYLETLIEGDLDEPTAGRFLDTARREALRLGRLIDNMFEFSLLDLSAMALIAGRCDVSRAAAQAVEVVAQSAAVRNISILNDIVMRVIVGVDEDACLQALINLLDNGIKYGRDGGSIALGIRVDGPFVRIHVDDDGPGVAPADQERIFAMRARGTQSGPGSGIGLAIVRTIAERAGGGIAVLESPLGGARFELQLPARAEC